MSHLSNLITKARNWWLNECCAGSVDYLAQGNAIPLDLVAACGLDVSSADQRTLLIVKCSKWGKKCEACPCIKAMRELYPADGPRTWDLNVPAGTQERETHTHKRDREATQVDYFYVHMGNTARVELSVARRDLDPQTVKAPVSPGVENPKHRTNQGDAQRDGLNKSRVHLSPLVVCGNYEQGGAA